MLTRRAARRTARNEQRWTHGRTFRHIVISEACLYTVRLHAEERPHAAPSLIFSSSQAQVPAWAGPRLHTSSSVYKDTPSKENLPLWSLLENKRETMNGAHSCSKAEICAAICSRKRGSETARGYNCAARDYCGKCYLRTDTHRGEAGFLTNMPARTRTTRARTAARQ